MMKLLRIAKIMLYLTTKHDILIETVAMVPGPQLRPMVTQSSTGRLSRRSLLKQPSEAVLDVEFRQVATPSNLSPIRARGEEDESYDDRNVYTDCSLDLDAVDTYQHYSVDASACMSRCPSSLAATGIDLSPLNTTPNSSVPPDVSTGRAMSDECASSRSRSNARYDLQDLFRDIMVYTQVDHRGNDKDRFVSPSQSRKHERLTSCVTTQDRRRAWFDQ